ncbi:hypothetical protein NQ315_007343 [Exocentrus adspersus]|uniref:Reverse transcriptase n=1 Tax=Exocentrus adspersus TaxID=1586481 RepID=A0AAV8V4P7_9CUCU|nr:hypothetical protein NQ315_007343 [Exocentrus adspersus]
MVLCGDEYKEGEILVTEDGTQTGELSRNESFRNMFVDVKHRLEVAGEKNCDRYNLRRRHVEFLPNQLVWRKNYVLSDAAKYFSQKLAPKYIGPLLVHKRVSPWTYELRDSIGNSKGVWHIKDLKAAEDMTLEPTATD